MRKNKRNIRSLTQQIFTTNFSVKQNSSRKANRPAGIQNILSFLCNPRAH